MNKITDTPTCLAGATVPCPDCNGCGFYSTTEFCSKCHGSGRVYVFGDEVREQCACDYNDWDRHECFRCYRQGFHNAVECRRCRGTNWTASEDGWVWLDSLPLAHVEFNPHAALQSEEVWTCRLVLIASDGDYGAAFFAALERAVASLPGVEM